MRRFLSFVLLFLIPTEAYAFDRANWFSTRGIRIFGQALTDGGLFGAPRYTTVLLPTCNASNTGAIAYDTTAGTHKACNGTAWAVIGGFSGGTVSGDTVFTGRVTMGSAADAANAVEFNVTAGGITFEGSAADANELTLTAANPGADVTVTIPATTTTLAGLGVAQTFSAANVFSSTATFGTALDDANSISAGVTAGCYTFEGSGADANETALCATNPSGDTILNLPNIGAATATVAVLSQNQTWTAIQSFTGTLNYVGGITAVTTTASTTAATSGHTFTNTGDADGASVSLLDNPTAGAWWNFAVTTAQTLTITPPTGETLYLAADPCVVSITSNTVGSTLTIRVVVGGSGGVFMSFNTTGTWTCNDV